MVMIENPSQPVSFVIYKTSERAESNMIDRRLLYVKNRNRLPLPVWCKWIVESNYGISFLYDFLVPMLLLLQLTVLIL